MENSCENLFKSLRNETVDRHRHELFKSRFALSKILPNSEENFMEIAKGNFP
jgi:hypothetical protein